MTKHIEDCTVLSNGLRMPWLGFGVWQVEEGATVEMAVRHAIQTGYRSIDTAAIYGNEDGVGKAIKESGVAREQLFLTTKVWNSNQGYESTLKAFEESRTKLQTDYFDLYLIHWPGPDSAKYLDTWRAMEKLYADGKVRAIGVCNFHVHHLQTLLENAKVAPMVNQVEFHPLLNQQELLRFCKENRIQLEAWSPLMQGHLDQPLLSELAEKYQKSPAQIVLRWDLQHEIVAIPKSITPHRIEENSQIFDFELAEEDMAKIDQLNENKRFGPNPDEMQRDF